MYLPTLKKTLIFPKILEVRAVSHDTEVSYAIDQVTRKALNEVTAR